jgi:hypothetical protein
MRKLITISLAVLLMGLSAAVVFAAVQSGDDTSPTTGTTETTETTTTPQHQQRERHRDRERERERRDDVRHNDDPATGAVDVSGPCDEAEHANDPRCTGASTGVAPKVEDENRADDDGVNHDHGGDGNQVEDHSGPGRGGDDGGVDDHSGSGHGGDGHGEDD